jgi:hypothetical protein
VILNTISSLGRFTIIFNGGMDPAVKVNSMCRGNYEDHQCRFQCKKSATVHIFCICQILEKKWEYSETVHQLFIDIIKAYESVRREVLY